MLHSSEASLQAGVRLIQAEPLRRFVESLVAGLGAPDDIAAEVARHLVGSNLAGHDSHGVIQAPRYAQQIEEGALRPTARPVLIRDGGATALIDAGRGFGQFSTMFALEWAVARAREHGVAAASIRGSMHIGRVGEYTERAAESGLVALVIAGAAGPGVGAMGLKGTHVRFLGTNPWSAGIPVEDGPPVVFDGATSTVAEGKVRLAMKGQVPIPEGYILNAAGEATTRAADLYDGGTLLPLGAPLAEHKGSGLALVAALLGGLGMIEEQDPALIGVTQTSVPDPAGRIGGVFLLAVDPAAFGDPDRYRKLTRNTVDAARSLPPAPGAHQVLMPGDPERLSRAKRTRHGIPVPDAVWEELARLAERLGLDLPDWGGANSTNLPNVTGEPKRL